MEFINYWAILVAAAASMALGAFWYSPIAFGKIWMRLSGMNDLKIQESKKKGMGKLYFSAFLGSLIMSYVLAYLLNYFFLPISISEGLIAGIWIWLGFMATKSISSVLWENKPFSLYLLNTAYDLISILLMAVILTLWI